MCTVALTVLLASVVSVGGQLVAAPAAAAGEPVTDVAPVADLASDTDGSCDTPPASYPGDGDPVPVDAGCTLVLGPDGAVVGEAWSWRDELSVHWYSYSASTSGELATGSVVMCGSTDPARAGVVYDCSPESPYLLFTVSNTFVELPASPTGPLHYCESVTFTGALGPVTGTACASVVARASSEAAATTPPPVEPDASAPTSPVAPPTTDSVDPAPPPSPTSAPTSTPVPTATADPPPSPVDTDLPAETESVPADPPSTTPSAPVDATPTGDVSTSLDLPTIDSTPLDSVSVAVVGGARFPLGFVIALAIGLALGGIVMLAAPGAAAARRHRR